MDKLKINDCCDLGVKDSCATCDYSCVCNGKWSHTTKLSVSVHAVEA